MNTFFVGYRFVIYLRRPFVEKVNIFGGFVVSQRMLDLFKKKGDKDYTGAGWFDGVSGLLLFVFWLGKSHDV